MPIGGFGTRPPLTATERFLAATERFLDFLQVWLITVSIVGFVAFGIVAYLFLRWQKNQRPHESNELPK